MANIRIVNKLPMQWKAGYTNALNGYSVEWAEHPTNLNYLQIFMWCDQEAINFLRSKHHTGKTIVFIRRYEYYSLKLEDVDWDKVDAVVMVNDFLAEGFKHRTGKDPHVIYNSIEPDKWKPKESSGSGKKIAWVGYVNLKKNLQLAMQIMAELPRDYELHIAGGIQDAQIADYAISLGQHMDIDLRFYQHIKPEWMDQWLDDKDCLLNTSISEGCPNSVIEAMAKGIKPVVHQWPGANKQFAPWTFKTVGEACQLIQTDIPPSVVRKVALEKFGPSNYAKFKQLVDDVLSGC
jgi:glycosyltransferase involved in cell wall biosynthesis